MNSFEIRTCLVIMFSAILIVTTRARFIYHPDPTIHCLEAKVPCSGHHSEDSCKEYCQAQGFIDGSCDATCCLCFSGHPAMSDALASMGQRMRHPLIRSRPRMTLAQHIPYSVQDQNSHPSAGPNLVSSPKIKRQNEEFNEIETEKTEAETKEGDKPEICLTPDCVKAAYGLLVNLDDQVDPCDDFYEFACGSFEKNVIIPDDKAELTPIGGLTDKLHLQVRHMIENIGGEKISPSARLVKNLYSSCVNGEIREIKGTEPLKSLLKKIGGWPVLEGKSWAPSPTFEWTDLVLKLRNEGIAGAYLLGIGVGPDIKNPGRRIINIGEPQLSFGREQMIDPVFINAYQKYQLDLSVLLGADPRLVGKEMGAVFQFERNLANISLPREATRAHPLKFYNPISISELQKRFPHVNWLHFVRSSLPDNLDINENEVVILSVPPHLVNLLRLIEMTDQRTLVNYLMWRAASSLVPYLGESANFLKSNFNAKVTGQHQKPPKWAECVGLVTSTFAHAVGKIYVEKHFDEKSREEAIKMFQDIHQSFSTVLDEATWMDPTTKSRAHEKARAMRSFTGYPVELLDENELIKLYDGLELSGDNFFENVLNITKSGVRYTLGKLRKPIDPNEWVGHGKPAVVNAFYNPSQNFITFPAGILQGHFFSYDRPHYMNFAAIGWVYGHELIHGFDDQGSRFDLRGDLKDWWQPATKQRYHEKTECIVQQYSKYSFTDLVTNITTKLNGQLSQGENIADNNGILLAYRGYQNWVKRNWAEQRLPGLEKYSPNQMFWITAANNWCSSHRPVAFRHKMMTGVHPPGKFRVLGSFSNSHEFAKDFNCPVGSRMNPVNKCKVW